MRGAQQNNSRQNNTHKSYNEGISSKQKRGQRLAQAFRTRQETTRVTTLLDAHDNKRIMRQQGRLALAKHVNILLALERRALRFSNKGQPRKDQDEVLYDEALDETGTVETVDLLDSDSDANSLGEQYQK